MTSQANCSISNPLKPSTLDVEVKGTGQCELAIVNMKNGTGPYKLVVVPVGRGQKTINFSSSPLGLTLDMSADVEYWYMHVVAHYDSAGNSAVTGPYTITATSNNACLGAASTGHTAIIGVAVVVSITAIIITALLLWFCYKRNRQRHESEKPDIEPPYGYSHTQYTPVPTTATHYTGSYHDVSTTGHYNPQVPVPYPLASMSVGDRNTTYSGEASGSEPSSMGISEKRRNLVNPDAHNLGPIEAEPFDPNSVSGTSRTHSGLPPLPPAYSAS
ncbi:hypothetical protein RHS01_01778 [Rhizoctonia solani]|uniref:Uncharacterized protein n=1 Tax=Rhizoctonia solani TaxID=456999 RepID=A0A8H7M7W8_9AGAM|nr:hypothetical protein RHS01_01778 [Rhizoctonia solani]